jgi:hypothetical protein
MPVIEKMRIAATVVIKNALGINIINLLLFTHLKERVANSIKKRYEIYSMS